MLKRTQNMLELMQDGFRNTLRVVVDIAEAVGVPQTLKSLVHGRPAEAQTEQTTTAAKAPHAWTTSAFPPSPTPTPASAEQATAQQRRAEQSQQTAHPAKETAAQDISPAIPVGSTTKRQAASSNGGGQRRRPAAKRRELIGNRKLSVGVRPLETSDAINGSTYLARIIWSLGVASLEGLGALRPADIARMVMSRSPVSLEPPNVARYIRRSKPTCIAIDHSEGSSNYYRLNEQGSALFRDHFAGN